MNSTLIQLRELHKRRSQGDSVFELRVPELDIPGGQLVAVVGASGCGKSTLLDLLALVMEPTEVQQFQLNPDPELPSIDIADLWESGAEVRLAALRRNHLGYVLQTGGLLPFLTVRENILLPARVKGLPAPHAELVELAERLGLASYLARYPDALSIGQRQRAAILRALLHQPRLVLADEPTAAVDKTRAVQIMAEFHGLARERGVTVVLVTHDLDLITDLADRVYTFVVSAESAQHMHSTCVRER